MSTTHAWTSMPVAGLVPAERADDPADLVRRAGDLSDRRGDAHDRTREPHPGNPLALLELPAGLSDLQYSALAALPAVLPLSRRLGSRVS
jgi:hypothetical protein